MARILIVEDDSIVRKLIAEVLRVYNYETIVAKDGREALDILAKFAPDLIISDIQMPGMNGLDFLQQVRKNNRHKFTPFLFLTSKTEPADLRKGMNLGADDYITKPVSREDLISALETRLKKFQEFKSEVKLTAEEDFKNDTFQQREELRSLLEKISEAEMRVLQLLPENLTSKEMADRLFLSKRTVENHRANMSLKLGFKDQKELVSFAFSCRLMDLL